MALVTKTHTPVNIEDRKKLGIQAGDTVRVMQKIQEGDKTRLQPFEGLVLARKHGNEPGATFTVRRLVDGTGVEKIFPLYSPMIDSIDIIRRAKVRRSKLYYIRDKAASQIRRQMRRMIDVDIKTSGESASPSQGGPSSSETGGEDADEEVPEETSTTDSTSSSSSEQESSPQTDSDQAGDFEEKMDDATVEEVKEEINEQDPEKSEIKQVEEKTHSNPPGQVEEKEE